MVEGQGALVVVVDTEHVHRIDEALRAAVGLTLRGERVAVALTERADAVLRTDPAASAARALATLDQLGHDVHRAVSPGRAAELARGGRAVEVWT